MFKIKIFVIFFYFFTLLGFSREEEVLLLCGDYLKNTYLNNVATRILFNDLREHHETILSNFNLILELVSQSPSVGHDEYKFLLSEGIKDKEGLIQFSRLAEGGLKDEEIPLAVSYLHAVIKTRFDDHQEPRLKQYFIDNVFLLKSYGFLKYAENSPINIRSIKDHFNIQQSVKYENVINDLMSFYKDKGKDANETLQKVTIALSELDLETSNKLIGAQKLYAQNKNPENPLALFYDFGILGAEHSANFSNTFKEKPLMSSFGQEASFRIKLLFDYLENKDKYSPFVREALRNGYEHFLTLKQKNDSLDLIWSKLKQAHVSQKEKFYKISFLNDEVLNLGKVEDKLSNTLYLQRSYAHKMVQEIIFSMLYDANWEPATVSAHYNDFKFLIINSDVMESIAGLFYSDPYKRRSLLRDFFQHYLLVKDLSKEKDIFLNGVVALSKNGSLKQQLNDVYDPGARKFLFTSISF